MMQTLLKSRAEAHGQSLAEFAIGFGVLVLVMAAGAYFGLGMYYGQMASDAIREITMEKKRMADDPGGYSAGDLASIINTSNVTSNIGTGSLLDAGSVQVVKDNHPTAIVVGHKSYTAMGIPLVFTVSQGIQRKLLEKNTGTKLKTDWQNKVGTPPWQNPLLTQGGTSLAMARCSPSSSSSVGEGMAQALANDTGTYLPAKTINLTSPMDTTTTFMLAKQEMGDCAGEGGSCQAEYNALLPKEKSENWYGTNFSVTYEYYNPPGAPGQTVKIKTFVDPDTGEPMEYMSDPTASLEPSDNLVDPQGFYVDPSGEYKKPPGDYVSNCKKRKQAQCALKAAVKRAAKIKAAYQEECNMQ